MRQGNCFSNPTKIKQSTVASDLDAKKLRGKEKEKGKHSHTKTLSTTQMCNSTISWFGADREVCAPLHDLVIATWLGTVGRFYKRRVRK